MNILHEPDYRLPIDHRYIHRRHRAFVHGTSYTVVNIVLLGAFSLYDNKI